MPAETGIARHIMAAYTSPSRGYVSYAIVQHPRGLKIPPAAPHYEYDTARPRSGFKVSTARTDTHLKTRTCNRLRFIPIWLYVSFRAPTFHSGRLWELNPFGRNPCRTRALEA